MGNKIGRRKQVVDEKYTRPQGLYQHRDIDHKKLRKLILDSKLAPCYPGDEDCSVDLDECPICFLYYPSLNRSRCCMKGICTECFLQMKPPHSTRPTQCPFCKTSNYAVEYRGVRTKEEKGIEQVEEQKVIEAQIRMRQQELQDAEERMQKRQDLSSSSRLINTGEVEYQDVANSSVPSFRYPAHGSEIVSSEGSFPVPASRHPSHSRQNREDNFDLDLEDIMVMEAIWLSIQMAFNATVELNRDQKKLINDIWLNRNNSNKFIASLHNMCYYFANIVNVGNKSPGAGPSRPTGLPQNPPKQFWSPNQPSGPTGPWELSNRYELLALSPREIDENQRAGKLVKNHKDLYPQEVQMQPMQTAYGPRTPNPLMGMTFPKGQSFVAPIEHPQSTSPIQYPQFDFVLTRLTQAQREIYKMGRIIQKLELEGIPPSDFQRNRISSYLQNKLYKRVLYLPEGPREIILNKIRFDSFNIFVALQTYLRCLPNSLCYLGIYKLQIVLPEFSFTSLFPGVDPSYLFNKGLIYSIEVTPSTKLEHLEQFNLPNRMRTIFGQYLQKFQSFIIMIYSTVPEWEEDGCEISPYHIILLNWCRDICYNNGPEFVREAPLETKMELAKIKADLMYRNNKLDLEHFTMNCQSIFYEVWSTRTFEIPRTYKTTEDCDNFFYQMLVAEAEDEEELRQRDQEQMDDGDWFNTLDEMEQEAIRNRQED